MSDYLKPTKISRRHQELNWANTIFNSHDSFCQCNNTVLHLLDVLKKGNLGTYLTNSDKTTLKQCLGIEETGDDHGEKDTEKTTGDVEDLLDGDLLEELFKPENDDG